MLPDGTTEGSLADLLREPNKASGVVISRASDASRCALTRRGRAVTGEVLTNFPPSPAQFNPTRFTLSREYLIHGPTYEETS
jgi:hypothetical protein